MLTRVGLYKKTAEAANAGWGIGSFLKSFRTFTLVGSQKRLLVGVANIFLNLQRW